MTGGDTNNSHPALQPLAGRGRHGNRVHVAYHAGLAGCMCRPQLLGCSSVSSWHDDLPL